MSESTYGTVSPEEVQTIEEIEHKLAFDYCSRPWLTKTLLVVLRRYRQACKAYYLLNEEASETHAAALHKEWLRGYEEGERVTVMSRPKQYPAEVVGLGCFILGSIVTLAVTLAR